jgi:hypothetical protein
MYIVILKIFTHSYHLKALDYQLNDLLINDKHERRSKVKNVKML